MKTIWTLTVRELKTFFDSLMAYLLLVLFLAATGFFTWLFGGDVFMTKQASLDQFFTWAFVFISVLIPAITMKMISEEKRTGTIELLLTKAISDWQVVLGKYLACFMLVLIALLLTLPYYFTVMKLGPVDHGAVLCGYFGLLLLSSALISIGIFASTVTSNQIVAFLLAAAIELIFLLIFYLMSFNAGFMSGIFDYLSFYTHFEAISRGLLDSRNIIYFISISLTGLIIAESVLAQRNVPS